MSKEWTARILWEPRDLWIGLYWNRERHGGFIAEVLDFYICIVPCFPVRLTRTTFTAEQAQAPPRPVCDHLPVSDLSPTLE